MIEISEAYYRGLISHIRESADCIVRDIEMIEHFEWPQTDNIQIKDALLAKTKDELIKLDNSLNNKKQ